MHLDHHLAGVDLVRGEASSQFGADRRPTGSWDHFFLSTGLLKNVPNRSLPCCYFVNPLREALLRSQQNSLK
jgi:hypothetical protein